MTTAHVLYLLMSVGVFVVFSAMLAHVSWLQSRRGPDMIAQTASEADSVRHTELSQSHPPLAA